MKTFSFTDWLNEGGNKGLRNYSLAASFQRVSWVYACIHSVATTASKAPLAFYEGIEQTKETRIVDPTHPVIQLFNPPFPPEIITLRDLLLRTFTHLGLSGGAYWVFEKQKGKWANVMLRPNLTPVRKSIDSPLIGWVEYKSSGAVAYTIDQVLPVLNYNPGDPYTGLSPLTAARLSIESEYNIAGWNTSFFRSGMKNPLLLQSKGSLTDGQKRDIKKEIINYYSGTEGGQSALLLSGNLEVKDMNINPKDVDFVMGKKLNREEICAIFGVPPALVGIFEYANYSNVKEQRKIFWENTLLPIMDAIVDVLQINILNTEFPGITAAWDLSNILSANQDPDVVAKAAERYWGMGYTPTQIATILKVPELDVPQDSMRDLTPQLPAAGNNANQNANQNQDKPKPNSNAVTDLVVVGQKQLGTVEFGSWLGTYGSTNKMRVDHHIKKLEGVVFDYVKRLEVLKEKNSVIDQDKWVATWKDTVGFSIKEIGKEGALEALTCMKTIANKGREQRVTSLKNHLDIKRIKSLEESLDSLVEFSCSVPKRLIRAKDLSQVNDEMINSIATTFAMTSHEQSKFVTYKLLGVSNLMWVSGDNAHKHLHGEGIEVGMEMYKDGFQYPYDSRCHHKHFENCRCTTVPVIFPVLN